MGGKENILPNISKPMLLVICISMIGCAGTMFTGPKEFGYLKLTSGNVEKILIPASNSNHPHRYVLAIHDANFQKNFELWNKLRNERKGSFKGRIQAKATWNDTNDEKIKEYIFESDAGDGFGGIGIPIGTIAFPAGKIATASVLIEIANEDTALTRRFKNLTLGVYEEYGK